MRPTGSSEEWSYGELLSISFEILKSCVHSKAKNLWFYGMWKNGADQECSVGYPLRSQRRGTGQGVRCCSEDAEILSKILSTRSGALVLNRDHPGCTFGIGHRLVFEEYSEHSTQWLSCTPKELVAYRERG